MRTLTLLSYLVALSACNGASGNDKNANANSLAAGTIPEVKAQTETPKRDANKSEVEKSVRPEEIVWDCIYDGSESFLLIISDIDYNIPEDIPWRIAVARFQIKGEFSHASSRGKVFIANREGMVSYQLSGDDNSSTFFNFPEMPNKIDGEWHDGTDLKCEKL